MKSIKMFQHMRKIIGLGVLLTLPLSGIATVDIRLSENLRQALEAQGWQAVEADDGSLIYRKPSVPLNQDQARPVMRTLGGEDLNRALEERGWQMQWSPEGSLLLKRQNGTPIQPDEASKDAMPKTEMNPAVRLTDQPGFEYWRIERQADGSLHFHPLAKAAEATTRDARASSPGACEGIEVLDPTVSLPVDQWAEARVLAQGWLNKMGLDSSQVGRIRKVLGVYLISLVDRAPPFHLNHQLAIRASDGRVILLE